MWIDRNWKEYFSKIRLDFDIVVDIWELMVSFPCIDDGIIEIKRNDIVVFLGYSKEDRGRCLLVSAAIHQMEDDGLVEIDRSTHPFKYRLNPNALKYMGCKKGRRSYKNMVKIWLQSHPNRPKLSQCARDLGLDRKTVRKWWD